MSVVAQGSSSGCVWLGLVFLFDDMAKRKRLGAQPDRGPKRARGSQVKIPCAWQGCKNKRADCKNKPFHAPIGNVHESRLRHVHASARTVRFCCKEHLERCLQGGTDSPSRRGGREALSPAQVAHLFTVLARKTPWAAVVFLLSVMTGERAEAVCKARDTWFEGLDPADGQLPFLNVPAVNKKTKSHKVPLHKGLSQLLWGWIQAPLKGTGGHQWPHAGQLLQFGPKQGKKNGRCLFPGRQLGGRNTRAWQKPVTTRGYYATFPLAQEILRSQLEEARRAGDEHPFQSICLKRVTTHCGKKSAVTMLAEHASTTIIAEITSTTARVLERVYVCLSFITDVPKTCQSLMLPALGPRRSGALRRRSRGKQSRRLSVL